MSLPPRSAPGPPSIRRLLVTGIAGNLGRRLAPQLGDREIVGLDLHEPPADLRLSKFISLDLSEASAQAKLEAIVAGEGVDGVLHLAFVIDPVQTGITDATRMWQANVQGTQRLLEAVAGANRSATQVKLFVFPSSVSAYGPDLKEAVREDAPLNAHTLPYAIHKRETDLICQQMHPRLGGAATVIFRPHIYAGSTVDNFILRAIRGRASGRGRLARLYERRGWRVPALLPPKSDGGALQFVHVDDVARVLVWTLGNYKPGALAIYNLAGKGPAITFADAARMAGTPIQRLPTLGVIRAVLGLFWKLGLSGVPPASIPYYLTSYTMDTTRLRAALGAEADAVLRYSTLEALEDALRA